MIFHAKSSQKEARRWTRVDSVIFGLKAKIDGYVPSVRAPEERKRGYIHKHS